MLHQYNSKKQQYNHLIYRIKDVCSVVFTCITHGLRGRDASLPASAAISNSNLKSNPDRRRTHTACNTHMHAHTQHSHTHDLASCKPSQQPPHHSERFSNLQLTIPLTQLKTRGGELSILFVSKWYHQ